MAFNNAVLPQLDAAYNLARWLTDNDHDAEDLVQEAFLRAFNPKADLSHRDGRCRLLSAVRNTFYARLRERWFESTLLDDDFAEVGATSPTPEGIALQDADREMLKSALENLPAELREALVLREMERLSYQEIADIANVPVGAVMSRLACARKRLQASLTHPPKEMKLVDRQS